MSAWLIVALAILVVPVLDPDSRRYLQTVGRARRVKRLRSMPKRIDPRTIIPPRSPSAVTLGRGLATLTKLVNEAKATPLRAEGPRPRPSSTPKSPPQGTSGVPRRPSPNPTKPYVYRA